MQDICLYFFNFKLELSTIHSHPQSKVKSIWFITKAQGILSGLPYFRLGWSLLISAGKNQLQLDEKYHFQYFCTHRSYMTVYYIISYLFPLCPPCGLVASSNAYGHCIFWSCQSKGRTAMTETRSEIFNLLMVSSRTKSFHAVLRARSTQLGLIKPRIIQQSHLHQPVGRKTRCDQHRLAVRK